MADSTYTEMARLQQSTLGADALTSPLARQLAAYWAREVQRLRAVPYVPDRMDNDPVWNQEYNRAKSLAVTLGALDDKQLGEQKLPIFTAVKRLAIELDRWLLSSTVKANAPGMVPSTFHWPGKPIIGRGTDVGATRGGGGGGLGKLLLAWLVIKALE